MCGRGTYRHVSELCVAPAIHPPFAAEHRPTRQTPGRGPDEAEPVAPEKADLAVGVHLEEDCPATVDEQVRVFRQDAVDEPLTFEEAELGVGLVGRNDVGDRLGTESLRAV